jgi:hypothetical protein
MTQQIWFAVLSSSVVSAIIGALIAGAYNLRAKRNEYRNEYFKTVVQRRLAAYEQLEILIVSLKTAVIDTDNKPYHFLFSKDEDCITAYKLLSDTMDRGLWLSDEAFEKTRDLNYRVFRLSASGGGQSNSEKITTRILRNYAQSLRRYWRQICSICMMLKDF